MDTPIFSHLQNYYDDDRITFAMPGHKCGRGLKKELINCDVTELKSTLDLHYNCEVIQKACTLLSERYQSDESFIVTCGSTACIQAMLCAVLAPGDTLLAALDCHTSVINTCTLCGFNLRFIPKTFNENFFIPDKLTDIEKIIKDNSDIKAVIITSPTYYGICADIASLANICHRHNIPLIVDEAHGAHFPASDLLPQSAVILGADAVCQSAHKTLNALTGAAFLHINGKRINRKKLKASLSMFQTSSPSYVIAASADIARAELQNGSWDEICKICDAFRKKILLNTKINILDNDDKTRIVLNFSEYETHGFSIEEILSSKYKIDVEMSDTVNIILIVTAYNTADELDSLYNALIEITDSLNLVKNRFRIPQPPVYTDFIQPNFAFWQKSKYMKLSDSVGYISAVSVCAYPPGIPIIFTGEKISREKIEYVIFIKNSGAKIKGLDNNMIQVCDSIRKED